MSPALSWLFLFLVVGGFMVVFWRMLDWIDRVLDTRNEWRRRR